MLNLSELPPSVRDACTHALGHHRDGSLGEHPCFMLSIAVSGIVRVEFRNGASDAPPFVFIWELLLTPGELLPVVDSVEGLGLSPERSMERMSTCLLAQLNTTVYKRQIKKDAVLTLAAMLDRLCYLGIVNYCEGQQKQGPLPTARPELN